MSHGFHILDVCARGLYSGNQLAVVLEVDDLDTDTMQAVALETNFSETTFVTGGTDDGGAYRVRIFTPTQELPFAGHPTLGTAWLIRHILHDEPPDRVELELGIGRVPVDFEGAQRESLGFLRAPAATFGQCLAAQEIAPALCLNAEDFSTAAPIQQVTAGLEFIVAPLASRDALSRCAPQKGPLDDLEKRGLRPFVYVFCTEPIDEENQVASRFFFETNGMREDPATGSATGALGHYLVEHRFFDSARIALRVEQGVQMGRPSLLYLRAQPDDVRVGGQVFEVAKGEIF